MEDAQDLVDDWVMVRPSDERKQLAVALFVTYRHQQGMGVTQAAQEAGSVSGFNECTVRRYWKEWCNNCGSFDDSVQGKYQRDTIFAVEELRRQALTWIRLNAVEDGQSNMTARSFAAFVNDELLPNSCLPPGFPRSISTRTAGRWLSSLGFEYMTTHSKRGIDKDGHERDVVAYRKIL